MRWMVKTALLDHRGTFNRSLILVEAALSDTESEGVDLTPVEEPVFSDHGRVVEATLYRYRVESTRYPCRGGVYASVLWEGEEGHRTRSRRAVQLFLQKKASAELDALIEALLLE